MKKIGIITPIASTILDEQALKRCKSVLPGGFGEVECFSLPWGPTSIETMYDEEYGSVAIYEEARRKKDEWETKYSALVINCFADPGVDGLRELLDIPVIGVGAAAFALAMQLAPRFSVISMQRNSVPHAWNRLYKMGLEKRVASVYGVEEHLEELSGGGASVVEKLQGYALKALNDDGADCIVLGCTGMADMAEELQKRLPAPLIEPTSAGLWAALAMCNLGLSHGRLWMYQKADPGKIIGKLG